MVSHLFFVSRETSIGYKFIKLSWLSGVNLKKSVTILISMQREWSNKMNFIKNNVLPVVIGIILALLIKQYVFTFATTRGTSMEPNLQDGQWTAVFKTFKIKRLSPIVFDAYKLDPQASQGDSYVKRVIGLPGDTVSFNEESGTIYVNGKKIKQNFISQDEKTEGTQKDNSVGNWDLKSLSKSWPRNKNSIRVPKGEYFVLGDHRSVSDDSRYWGFVPKSHVTGVVKALPWSQTKQKRVNINSLGY